MNEFLMLPLYDISLYTLLLKTIVKNLKYTIKTSIQIEALMMIPEMTMMMMISIHNHKILSMSNTKCGGYMSTFQNFFDTDELCGLKNIILKIRLSRTLIFLFLRV